MVRTLSKRSGSYASRLLRNYWKRYVWIFFKNVLFGRKYSSRKQKRLEWIKIYYEF